MKSFGFLFVFVLLQLSEGLFQIIKDFVLKNTMFQLKIFVLLSASLFKKASFIKDTYIINGVDAKVKLDQNYIKYYFNNFFFANVL